MNGFIMRCVKSFAYSVVINGAQGVEFKPTRGLRQGHPLSPYLFIIYVEGFSKLAKVERNGLSVTQLFFAYGSILFGEATNEGSMVIKSVVNEYEKISGQLINFDKSLIYFSSNVCNNVRCRISNILGVRISNNPEKYPGLPTMVGRQKKNTVVNIKEIL
ncbi:reverse transcriptase [Gossypium australe]|uniref:Reverse transcriptase n=1 Tax=Gossypium australe TaxID=47621 RepID=A0A5B6VVK9_9ROSI|nr:reverse transcriptase [Gossypium australe]